MWEGLDNDLHKKACVALGSISRLPCTSSSVKVYVGYTEVYYSACADWYCVGVRT